MSVSKTSQHFLIEFEKSTELVTREIKAKMADCDDSGRIPLINKLHALQDFLKCDKRVNCDKNNNEIS